MTYDDDNRAAGADRFVSDPSDAVDTSPSVGDEVKTTTCYMCACRCGIRVSLQDGRIRYIEGNPDHPVNKGVICGKGAAGIMNHYSPARLSKPLLRTGPRGSGEFKEIDWDEAMDIACAWLSAIRQSDPRKLAFFTGRDQSQALTGWWASQFGTCNYAAHGGFCSVNMAAGGMYTIGGSFWEFGEPDYDRAKYFMMFGVAEDHDSNPIKIGLGKLKQRGAKFVSVNPVRTGYSAIADEWIGIRPGTDGLFAMALIHELLRTGNVDVDYLARYTNAIWLVIRNPGEANDGLFARDADGNPLCWDGETGKVVNALLPDAKPVIAGEFQLGDGTKVAPVFQLMVERYSADDYAPDTVAPVTGIPAGDIRRIAAELAQVAFQESIELDIPWTDWAGRRHEKMIGRPVAMHAMRGISAHSNGFHTCRALHLLQMLLGSIDCPGGFRYKPPYPQPAPPPVKPGDTCSAGEPLNGPPLGFPSGPEDLLVNEDGSPKRIDKAFSWEHPFAAHGMMHMVITNAWKGDPYPIDTLMMFMANMSWNSTMNTKGVMRMLTDKDDDGEYRIPHIIYSDAYFSEMVPYADLIFPDTTYLERYDCISLLDRPISNADGPADAIRQPVLQPDREVRPFQDVLIDLGARLGLPGLVNDDGSPKYPGGFPDYMVNHERAPGIGMLGGWRGANGDQAGKGDPNPDQLQRYIDNGCFWQHRLDHKQRYYKMANRDYLDWAQAMGFVDKAEQIVLQMYSEPLQHFRLAAQGHGDVQPPDTLRDRVATYFDPLPIWYTPFEEALVETSEFPLHALTQRPMEMYHSWGAQNAWLRQITSSNRMYIHHDTAAKLGIKNADWIRVTSHHGSIKVQVQLMSGVNPDTIWTWNAIGHRRGAWNLDKNAEEGREGFLLNHIISELLPPKRGRDRLSNSDPVTGQAAWYDLRVRVEKVAAGDQLTEPQFPVMEVVAGVATPTPEVLQYGKGFRKDREES